MLRFVDSKAVNELPKLQFSCCVIEFPLHVLYFRQFGFCRPRVKMLICTWGRLSIKMPISATILSFEVLAGEEKTEL